MILYNVKLKPCPFCEAKMQMLEIIFINGKKEYRIEGDHKKYCPFSIEYYLNNYSKEFLEKCWNTRAESEVDTQE